MEKDDLIDILYKLVMRLNFLTLENERLTQAIKETLKSKEGTEKNG